jgi:hypothetical protein
MTKQLLKPVLLGILAGGVLFILPFFLLRTLLFVLLIGGLFRLLAGRRFGWGRYGYGPDRGHGPDRGFTPALADTIRSMSEEEYQVFRQRFGRYANPSGGEGPQPANP